MSSSPPRLPKTRVLFVAVKPSVARWKLYDKQKEANALVQARRFAEAETVLAGLALSFAGNDAYFSLRGTAAPPRFSRSSSIKFYAFPFSIFIH